MSDKPEKFFPPTQQGQAVINNASQVFTVGEVGAVVNRSASSIRRLAGELKIEPQRTGAGIRIFNAEQVQKIANEVQRRDAEAARR
jgi:nitrous oxidase accessory protein NosD